MFTEAYVINYFSLVQSSLISNGQELRALCPFHIEKTPSFFVNLKTGKYYCFGCNAKGCLKQSLISSNLQEIKAKLNNSNSVSNLSSAISLPTGFISCYDLNRSPKWTIPKYLYLRGLTQPTIKYFKLGYCIDGYYRNSIILPIFEQNNLVGFVARSFSNTTTKKYKYPKGFKKKLYFYNIDAIVNQSHIFLVEGPFDVLVLYELGIYNAIALLGKYISKEQVDKLCTFKLLKHITLFFDSDVDFAHIYSCAKILQARNFFVDNIFLEKGDPGELFLLNNKKLNLRTINFTSFLQERLKNI